MVCSKVSPSQCVGDGIDDLTSTRSEEDVSQFPIQPRIKPEADCTAEVRVVDIPVPNWSFLLPATST